MTVGSAATPMGNPQNLLIAVSSGLEAPVLQFAYHLLDLFGTHRPSATALVLRYIFRKQMGSLTVPSTAETGVSEVVRRDGPLAEKATAVVILTMSGILLVNAVAIFGVHEPFGISEVSLFGAVLLLVISGKGRGRSSRGSIGGSSSSSPPSSS